MLLPAIGGGGEAEGVGEGEELCVADTSPSPSATATSLAVFSATGKAAVKPMSENSTMRDIIL